MEPRETESGSTREGEGQRQNPTVVKLDEEKTEPTPSNLTSLDLVDIPEEAPDGGLRAWLVTVGAAFITFAGLGFGNSFGAFQQYYQTHQLHEDSPDKIAWIGSLSFFLQFAIGAVSGPLFDRFGAWMIRPAAVLFVFAVMMLSLCHEYWQFILVQGLVTGIAMGLLIFPAIAATSQYFNKKRATALGLVVSGSSIGGVVMPIALSKMLNGSSLGFGWSVRVIGFLMMPILAFSCVAVKSRLPPRATNFFIRAAFKDPKFLLLVAAYFFMSIGIFTPLFFLPTYAVSRGVDPTLASYLLAILNAASTLGRIIPGMLADRYGKFNVFALGGIITGIVTFFFNKAESTAGLVVYSVVFGVSSGTIISGASTAFSICPKDPRDIGTYMGMGMAFSSIAALIGPPINGVFVSQYGGYSQVSIFSGTLCLVGGCTAFLAKAATPQGILGRI